VEGQSTPNLLVVDDDEGFRYILVENLHRVGFNASAAVNGSHAIQVLRSGKQFDLIITDLKMPLKTGVDLLKFLAESSPKASVIILTGYPERDKILAAAQLGFKDVLLKPVKTSDLVTLIKQKLARPNLPQAG
jgi:CheY-like chemotaxis protein